MKQVTVIDSMNKLILPLLLLLFIVSCNKEVYQLVIINSSEDVGIDYRSAIEEALRSSGNITNNNRGLNIITEPINLDEFLSDIDSSCKKYIENKRDYVVVIYTPSEDDWQNIFDMVFIDSGRKSNIVLKLEHFDFDIKDGFDFYKNEFINNEDRGVLFLRSIIPNPKTAEIDEKPAVTNNTELAGAFEDFTIDDLYWNYEPEPEPIFADYTLFGFTPYNGIGRLQGSYGVITSIDGLFTRPEIRRDQIAVSGGMIVSGNLIADRIISIINDNNLIDIFYDLSKRTPTGVKIEVVEYITTGDIQYRIIIGPFERSGFNMLKNRLNSSGIKLFSRVINPLELM